MTDHKQTEKTERTETTTRERESQSTGQSTGSGGGAQQSGTRPGAPTETHGDVPGSANPDQKGANSLGGPGSGQSEK